jgi:hypothetical protein
MPKLECQTSRRAVNPRNAEKCDKNGAKKRKAALSLTL